MVMSRKILVTSALPYSNGSIHLGHLVEYIQTDVWVRFQKQSGHTCYYICADDNHGAPVMLRAQKEGITPETLISQMRAEHLQDFSGFLIDFDHYYQTHSEETRELSELFYRRLNDQGLIEIRSIEQFYDPVQQMFLPDRFIKGECPKCHAKDQYGDNCECCGTTYQPTELINPYSAISGATPELRESDHHFFRLSDPKCIEFLRGWIPNRLQPEVVNKLSEWLDEGLADWDISRDAPYFGFEIPDYPGKYFYVWLDAPVGYMGSFKKFCEIKGIDFDEFWAKDAQTELYHFIGKDILYFHTLFWPTELFFAGLRVPTNVFCHGFLTVNGVKMSKSRGTFMTASSFLKHVQNPEYLRYYYAAKLNTSLEDIDLNLDDFVQRINSDLVGKYVNIASRSAKFLEKYFDNRLADKLDQTELLGTFRQSAPFIYDAFEKREFSKAIREIMRLADLANQYVDTQKPWGIAKQNPHSEKLHQVCTTLINAFRLLTIYLKPVLPKTAASVEVFLKVDPLVFSDIDHDLLDHQINSYVHLMNRIDHKTIEAMIEENKQSIAAAQTEQQPACPSCTENNADQQETIGIDDFNKLDLRVGKVLAAEDIEGSNKLLKLSVDLGEKAARTIFSGIKPKILPEMLIGRHVVIVANLAPRKMKFGVSEGMMLLASSEAGHLVPVFAQEGAVAGMKVS